MEYLLHIRLFLHGFFHLFFTVSPSVCVCLHVHLIAIIIPFTDGETKAQGYPTFEQLLMAGWIFKLRKRVHSSCSEP